MKTSHYCSGIAILTTSLALGQAAIAVPEAVSAAEAEKVASNQGSVSAKVAGAPIPAAATQTVDPNTASSQGSTDSPVSVESELRIKQYLAQIDRLESEGNAYDSELAESAYGLGRALQDAGQYEAAIPVFVRALQITRINDGIYSPTQVPMLRGVIESQKASDHLQEAAEQYQHLFWINSRAYGDSDPRLIPLLEEISHWHLQVYSSQPARSKLQHLVESHSLASNAISLATVTGGQFSLGLIPLLKDVIRSSFYLAKYQQQYPEIQPEQPTFSIRQSPMEQDPFPSQERNLLVQSYANGVEAYGRIIDILHNNSDATSLERANALAELGDWHLVFGRRSSARNAYMEANRVISAEPDYEQLVTRLFGAPKMLPVILDEAESLPEVSESTPYVRVELDVLPTGVARNIRVLATHPEGSDDLAATALRLLRNARFRPVFVDGEPGTATGTLLKVRIAEG